MDSIKYTKVEWKSRGEDGKVPEGAPAINAVNLNRMEDGIEIGVEAMQKAQKTESVLLEKYVRACDVSNRLFEINPKKGESIDWTATDDCWISIYISGDINDDEISSVKVNGVDIFTAYMDSSSSSVRNSFLFPPCFFAKQGSIITVSGGEPIIKCFIYGCL